MKTLSIEIPVRDEKDVTMSELIGGVLSLWYDEDILIGDIKILPYNDEPEKIEQMYVSYKISNKNRTRDYTRYLKEITE